MTTVQFNRNALMLSASVAALAMGFASRADAATFNITTNSTTAQTLATGETGTVASGVTLSQAQAADNTDSGAATVAVTNGAAAITVTNSGTITGQQGGANAADTTPTVSGSAVTVAGTGAAATT
ncbi:MAG: hypothetical protein ING29_19210, partial [Azospirillum sp.]|nr:hypothetical protein [Azospirillum sp.]